MILGQVQETRLHDPSCACSAKQLASWQIPTQHDSQMNCQETQTYLYKEHMQCRDSGLTYRTGRVEADVAEQDERTCQQPPHAE